MSKINTNKICMHKNGIIKKNSVLFLDIQHKLIVDNVIGGLKTMYVCSVQFGVKIKCIISWIGKTIKTHKIDTHKKIPTIFNR